MVIVNSVSKQVSSVMRSALRRNLSLLEKVIGDENGPFVLSPCARQCVRNKVVPPDCFTRVKVTYMKIWKVSWIPHFLPMELDNTTLSCKCKRLTSGSSGRKCRGFRTHVPMKRGWYNTDPENSLTRQEKPSSQNTLHVGVAVNYLCNQDSFAGLTNHVSTRSSNSEGKKRLWLFQRSNEHEALEKDSLVYFTGLFRNEAWLGQYAWNRQ